MFASGFAFMGAVRRREASALHVDGLCSTGYLRVKAYRDMLLKWRFFSKIFKHGSNFDQQKTIFRKVHCHKHLKKKSFKISCVLFLFLFLICLFL